MTNEDESKFATLSNPIPWQGEELTGSRLVASRTSAYRDAHIAERILSPGSSSDFVVYGSAHVIKLEPALRALLEPTQGHT